MARTVGPVLHRRSRKVDQDIPYTGSINAGSRNFRKSLLILMLGLLPVVANADDVYGTAFKGPQYHMSTDTKAVQVILKHFHTENPPEVLEVPRAYITYVPRESDLPITKIPDRVTWSWFKVSIWLPTGEPYSVALKRLRGRSPVTVDDVKQNLATIDINFVKRDRAKSIRDGLLRHSAKQLADYQGLKVVQEYPVSDELDYFREDKDFRFIHITCSKTARLGKPCTYTFSLCPDLIARAQFDDFRVRGGLKFANEQLRRINGVTSQWIGKCN